ncbi:MAG: crossover junction endodeoxyribonuclease RuvC [bacterium]|nr:crossover junction endodeoxyribonuclease RuvC [bacterium]
MTFEEIRTLVLDPSLRRTGFYRSDTNSGGVIDTRKPSHNEALYIIGQRTAELITDCSPDLLLIEDYSYSTSTRSTTALGEVRGVITYVAREFGGVPIVTIPVQTWKAKTIGRIKKQTALEKREYLEQAKLLCRRSFADIDEADAFMIYRAAAYLCTHEPKHKVSKRITAAIDA